MRTRAGTILYLLLLLEDSARHNPHILHTDSTEIDLILPQIHLAYTLKNPSCLRLFYHSKVIHINMTGYLIARMLTDRMSI